ncbi:hypothetical protein [Ornithinibacillus xuwenensis]|uniref:Uncharacterized protein n=1 Tax=Ornithinibacillus xuwenensis TaxID=3144668 RepID=A0ABU9XJ25_9BACI
MENKKSNRFWGFIIVLAILLAYIIPFSVLSTIQAWNGSFLYWGITGVVIILANIMITRDWRE